MRRLLMLTMAALFAGSTSTKTLAENKSYLGSQWINIGHPGARVEIKKSSIKREGNTVTSEFAYFAKSDYTSQSLELMVHGKRIDTCKGGKVNADQIKYIWVKARQYDENYQNLNNNLSSISPNDLNKMWSYVEAPPQNILLHRYLCDNLNPNYLKAGMSVLKAKKLLYANDFKIIEQHYGTAIYNPKICDTKTPCYGCSNGHVVCTIEFLNKKTGVKLGLVADDQLTVVIDTRL